MKKEEILSTRWTNLGRWMQSPLGQGCFWVHWHEAKSTRDISPGFAPEQLLFLDGYTLVRKADQKAIREWIRKMDQQGQLEEYCTLFERVAAERKRRHLAALSKNSDDIGEYVRELFDSYLEVIGVWTMAILVAIEAEAYARSKKLIASDDEMLARVQPYLRTTWLEEQLKDVKRIAQALRDAGLTDPTEAMLRSHPAIASLVEEHLKTFGWFGTHHWEGEGYDAKKLLADVRRTLTSGTDVTSAHAGVSASTNSAHVGLWKLIALCAYWRTHAAEVTDKVILEAREVLAGIGGRWGMTYDDLLWLAPFEVEAALHAGSLTFPADLSERHKAYGYYLDEEGGHLITGSELAAMIGAVLKRENTEGVREFKGVVASKGGIVRGRAKLVLSPRDFAGFQEGDILVANETTPDFVPLMKIAAAIVTDTGGITSHAAIVSRELKKPCVIGTKIATQVLKDGDLVEMDADRGVVTIIKTG